MLRFKWFAFNLTSTMLLALTVGACQTAKPSEGESSLQGGAPVQAITCANGQQFVSFKLEPPSVSIPATDIPLNLFETNAMVHDTNKSRRIRLDACMNSDDSIELKRIVIGMKDWSQINFSQIFIDASDNDTVTGLKDAAFGENIENLSIVSRIAVINRENFRIQGFKSGNAAYVVSGPVQSSSIDPFVIVGTLVVGDDISEWYGGCEPGFDPVNVNYTVGSAQITGEVCSRWFISGESEGYGSKISVTDTNTKLPAAQRGTVTYTGAEARQVFTQGTGHHTCWFQFHLKLPNVEYIGRDESLPSDNFFKEVVTYQGHPPEERKIPAAPHPGPC